MCFETLSEINEHLVYIGNNPEQYKDAIIGISSDDNHIIYSYNKLVEVMSSVDGMGIDDAEEFIQYNTLRSINYAGEYAPIVMFDIDE